MIKQRSWYRWSLFISIMLLSIFFLISIIRFIRVVSIDEYYVGFNGNDRNPGTIDKPWRTIQKATNSMGPGDTVIVLAGEYGERVQVTRSGVSGFPITYRTEGKVTIKGFTVQGDYITIQGFEITDTDNDWREGWGIFLEGSYCVLDDNYIYFATRGGIVLYANEGDNPKTSNNVVKNNRLRRNAHVGINVQGRNNLVEGNEIWGTIQHHPKWDPVPTWADADGMRFFGRGHTIRKNYIHDITFEDPENVTPHIDCFQTWGKVIGTEDVVIEQNFCQVLTTNNNPYENGHGFMLADARNIIIRNNIIQAYGGVNTGGGGNSDLTIVNNVFLSNLTFQIYPGGVGLEDCPNTIVKNNIFYDQPQSTISVIGNTSGQEIDYNIAYRSDGKPSKCYQVDYMCVDPSPEHHLWDVNPMFVDARLNDFRLQPGSPAVDAGTALSEVTQDYSGNERPQGEGFDIGVFEYTIR